MSSVEQRDLGNGVIGGCNKKGASFEVRQIAARTSDVTALPAVTAPPAPSSRTAAARAATFHPGEPAIRHERSGAVLLPSSVIYACQLVDEGSSSGAWVYCWNQSKHVKLTDDGQFSLTQTAPVPSGLGGPGEVPGSQLYVGRFRCDVLAHAVRCTVRSTGKGFLLTNTSVTAVSSASTPAPTVPAPSFGHTAVVQAISGTVLLRAPGSTSFTPLSGSASVPLGTTLDTTNGTVALRSARDAAGHTETGQFYGGIFRITQTRGASRLRGGRRVGITVLTLAGAGCGASAAVRGHQATATRRLWGDAHGNFRTRGRYASATVRGTRWLTEDTCRGTVVKVARGVVSVLDLRTGRTVLVRAGGSFVAASGSAPTPVNPQRFKVVLPTGDFECEGQGAGEVGCFAEPASGSSLVLKQEAILRPSGQVVACRNEDPSADTHCYGGNDGTPAPTLAVGEQSTIGRYLCKVIASGVECTLAPTGPGFRITVTEIALVGGASETSLFA
ncbi:MAG TPA: hypothetical protein VMB05_18070 [Solirubrobacteraceae bacterium]|nr:hypothetical protein [Solirubrobacteraceae bacterium]